MRGQPELAAAVHEEFRAPATQRFEYADLFKPQEGDAVGLNYELAPLLLQERPGDTATTTSSDHRHRRVFVTEATAILGGREYHQLAYRWVYTEKRTTVHSPTTSAMWRGVRLTLDEHDYPLVYEVIGDDIQLNRLFISNSLELAALNEYGAPLPGRISSAERSMQEEPMTLVVRVLEVGSVPMGPIVYIAAPERTISSIICRCMPSQVSNIVRTEYYRLIKPTESRIAQMGSVFDCPGGIDDPSRLERILRWPHGL